MVKNLAANAGDTGLISDLEVPCVVEQLCSYGTTPEPAPCSKRNQHSEKPGTVTREQPRPPQPSPSSEDPAQPCVCALSRSAVSDSCDPIDRCLPGSSVHGTLQARILTWVAISFSTGPSPPRNRTRVSCTAGRLCTD